MDFGDGFVWIFFVKVGGLLLILIVVICVIDLVLYLWELCIGVFGFEWVSGLGRVNGLFWKGKICWVLFIEFICFIIEFFFCCECELNMVIRDDFGVRRLRNFVYIWCGVNGRINFFV